jgi:hypothetical protein
MPTSAILRRVALVRIDDSEELVVSRNSTHIRDVPSSADVISGTLREQYTVEQETIHALPGYRASEK